MTLHWEPIITKGDPWRYKIGSSAIPADWMLPEFNDGSWSVGISGFGYGDNDDATVVASGTISVFVRKHFIINDLTQITGAVLHVDFDDGFVAYLNGVEVARANLGTVGTPAAYNQTAGDHEAGIPLKCEIIDYQTLLRNGDNVLALQVHNSSSSSSDLSLVPYLSLGMTEIPTDTRGESPFSDLPYTYLHTNFKIDAAGETITLCDQTGRIIDQVESGNIPTDVSRGRQPDGSADWYFFNQPTPGTANITLGYLYAAPPPHFSLPGGFYAAPVQLSLTCGTTSAAIYYTLNGSEPTLNSSLYSQPLTITSTTVVRARAFGPNLLPSQTVTNTYFITSKPQVAVISLATNPGNFFDLDTGIYMMGRNPGSENPYFGANFWQDWERPVHVEFFEPDGRLGFSQDAGVKIAGGWSRAVPQKPLSIYARSKYGAGSFNYRIFPDRPFDAYEAFMLKNGGNDWGRTFFSDAMMHSLLEGQDLEIMAFRPCIVYLNGEYWGIYNLREKQNEHYLAQYFDVDPDSIDLLELNQSIIQGSAEHYAALINFITSHDLQIDENYNYVQTQMDVANFITYMAAEIFYDNRDWPGNNIKYWRPQRPTGRWRWLLYDVDWGFGLNAYDPGPGYNYNTLAFATEANGPDWPNPPWSTLLFRKLLTNNRFRNAFINRCADLMNTIFQPTRVQEKIDAIKALYEPEIPAMIQKWGRTYPQWGGTNRIWYSSISDWYNYVNVLKNFGNNRIPYMQAHVVTKFGLPGMAKLTVDVAPAGSGQVVVSTVVPTDFPWQGTYFQRVPIPVRAVAGSGCVFDHWEGMSNETTSEVNITLTRNADLKAVFRPAATTAPVVIINEINYNAPTEFDPGDWLEIYNPTSSELNLGGWTVRDLGGTFTIPANTIIAPHGYLVIAQDTVKLRRCFPQVSALVGNLPFGLNSQREVLRICDPEGRVCDSVAYTSRYPWPLLPDGGGPTVELINPDLDNNLPANWISSKHKYGSPGVKNGDIVLLSNKVELSRGADLRLLPNSPNPFNARTTFRFELPSADPVVIKIYNLRGQLVDELTLAPMRSGYQEICWSPSGLSAGIYLYQIHGRQVMATGKCLLVK